MIGKLFGRRQSEQRFLSEFDQLKSQLPEKLKIFFSHRHEHDDQDVQIIVDRVKKFALIQDDDDQSVYSHQALHGPRGGELPELTLKRKIADRIRRCHLVLCPNSRVINDSDWITWELEIGAIALRKPVLFVNTKLSVQRNVGVFQKLKDAGLKVAQCGNDTFDIMHAVVGLGVKQTAIDPASNH